LPSNRVIDFVFNSPSNHRVHHSRDPRHIDKNLGGLLIIWDRLFGTYQREEGPVVYGAEQMPSRPHNPVHVELYLWAALLRRCLARVRARKAGGGARSV